MSELNLPPQCVTCPRVTEGLIRLEEGRDALEMMQGHAEEGFPDNLADRMLKVFARIETRATDDESFRRQIRKNFAERMNELESMIEQDKFDLWSMTVGCGGLLRMRAIRDKIAYTVDVCTSTTANVAGDSLEAANVLREEQR